MVPPPDPAAGQVALTDRALVVISPDSVPAEAMRVGCIRTMVSSNRSPKALPPDGTTDAVPRTSIMRGCHGGSTSSITMLARPVRCPGSLYDDNASLARLIRSWRCDCIGSVSSMAAK